MQREPDDLVGKRIIFSLAEGHRGRCGTYTGRVTKVKATRKGVSGITVRRWNVTTERWNGAKYALQPNEWSREWCGVVWRGRLVPLKQWLAK